MDLHLWDTFGNIKIVPWMELTETKVIKEFFLKFGNKVYIPWEEVIPE